MAIVLEGFDNSGKSTLAGALPFPVVHPGPRPKTSEEETSCLTKQQFMANHKLVMDRITCISTACYTHKVQPYMRHAQAMAGTRHCAIVYCRPPLEVIQDFSRHIAKSYDEADQLERLHRSAATIVGNYDAFMRYVPHLRYDYTNPDQGVIDAAIEAQHSVRGWYEWIERVRAART